MALTELSVRRTNKIGKHADGHGLYLQIAPKGGKYWRYAYRFDGKQKTLALGTYPVDFQANLTPVFHSILTPPVAV